MVKVQAGYRDGGGMGSPAGDVTVSYPVWLRIVATTRRDPEVLARLKDLEAPELRTQDPRNLEDVRQFVTDVQRLVTEGM